MSKPKRPEPRRILVAGDFVLDHHIYRGPCAGGGGACIVSEIGGAGLTARILTTAFAPVAGVEVVGTTPAVPANDGDLGAGIHAYATWKPYPKNRSADKKAPPVWRVGEALGFGRAKSAAGLRQPSKVADLPTKCDVLVVDDGNREFRNDRSTWPAALRGEPTGRASARSRSTDSRPWVVLKMANPVCRGQLWTHLARAPWRDRLIVIVSADELRASGASISQGLSWERSVQELLGDLRWNAETNELCRARHLIVNFGHDGAVWLDNTKRAKPVRRLIFDPGHLEGDWQEDLEGAVLGAGSCLPAAVCCALFESSPAPTAKSRRGADVQVVMPPVPDIAAGVARGLAARRALLLAGHGAVGDDAPGFPDEAVRNALSGARGGDLRTVTIPDFAIPRRPGGGGAPSSEWSIIAGSGSHRARPLYGRARSVAVKGEAALSGIPFGRFGKLYTVDRIELSSLNGIRRLMKDYCREENPGKPLSLGVFGPPGSGKSFGIKQIAKGILGGDAAILTFNLSQFKGPEMLFGALHQVRDEVLKGKVPVAFWDEFDCGNLFWLQYLLAPMNDGEFLEGQITHPIGKCIFVFAGGTSQSLEAFVPEPTRKRDLQRFVAAKGPDFVSRLKGYLNVLGPNPRLIGGKADENDVGFPIRRAIMLRVQAGRFESDPLAIDPGLLNALLKIRAFKHGARSMETIIKLTSGDGRRGLLRCHLPPREQLGLHVDYDEFVALVHEGSEFRLRTEALAPHVHGFYLGLARKERWKPTYPMAYEKLPLDIKQDNIAAARRIPDVLSLAGLNVVERGNGTAAPATLVRRIIEENIELLAEAEHDGWMDYKLANRWEFNEKRDDAKKRHDLLVPYNDLHEESRDKDRNAVRHYPDIVRRAKFVIRVEGS